MYLYFMNKYGLHENHGTYVVAESVEDAVRVWRAAHVANAELGVIRKAHKDPILVDGH